MAEKYQAANEIVDLLLEHHVNPDNEFIGTDDGVDGIRALLNSKEWPSSARKLCGRVMQDEKKFADGNGNLRDLVLKILNAPEQQPKESLANRFKC